MVRSRLGLKTLSLCALVLGLMAIGASGAQASEWYYLKGTELLAMKDLLPSVQIALESTATLHFETAAGTKVLFLCPKAEAVGVKLVEGGKTTKGKVKFTGCTTDLNGAASKPCEPFTGANKGEIVTNEGLGSISLHGVAPNNVPTFVVSPETGTTLATIQMGETCSIGESVPVTGTLVLEDCLGLFTKEKINHLIQEHATLHNLLALGRSALLLGSANAFLTGGEHLNLEWAGLHA